MACMEATGSTADISTATIISLLQKRCLQGQHGSDLVFRLKRSIGECGLHTPKSILIAFFKVSFISISESTVSLCRLSASFVQTTAYQIFMSITGHHVWRAQTAQGRCSLTMNWILLSGSRCILQSPCRLFRENT